MFWCEGSNLYKPPSHVLIHITPSREVNMPPGGGVSEITGAVFLPLITSDFFTRRIITGNTFPKVPIHIALRESSVMKVIWSSPHGYNFFKGGRLIFPDGQDHKYAFQMYRSPGSSYASHHPQCLPKSFHDYLQIWLLPCYLLKSVGSFSSCR